MANEVDPKDLQNAVREGVREGMADSGSRGGGIDTDKLAANLKTGFTEALSQLGNVLGVKLDALKTAPQAYMGFQGSSNPNDAVNVAINNTLKLIPDKLQGIADGIKYFVGVLNDMRADARTMGGMGVGQGNVPGTRYAVQQAGYPDIATAIAHLASTDKTLKGIGETMDQSTGRFLDFAEKIRNDPQIKEMIKRGIIRPEDIPKIAALAAGGKTQMLDTPEGRARLAQQTASLAQQLEAQVQAYGLNRDAVIANQQALNNSTDEQLRMQALKSDAERQSVRDMEIKAAGQGKSIQTIIAALAAGQRLTREQQIMLQMATGGRAGQLRTAVREMKRTSGLAEDDPARIAAEERYKRELANMNAAQNSRRFAQIGLNTADPAVRGAIETLQKENEAKASQGKTQQATGLSPANAMNRQMAEGSQNMYGYKQESIRNPDEPKQRNAEAESLKLISTISEQARLNAIAATGVFADLNRELGKAPEKLKPIYNFFDWLLGPISQSAADRKKEAYDPIVNLANTFLNPNKPEKPSGVPTDRSRNPPSVAIPNSTVNLNNPATVNVNGANLPSGLPSGENRGRGPERGTGTLGETGVPLEPKDVVAKLHKGETVLTPSQLANLINGTKESVLNSINSSITSISGGGSTTRREVQGEAAKEAEKKIEAIKSQYAKDRAELTAKIKEGLGPDARPGEVLKALKSNPEARNLEAQMRSTISGLTETVRVGTKTETVKSVPSMTDAFKNFKPSADMLEEDKEEESSTKMEFPQQDSVGLKDLHGELIQLNTHIRQLIEHSADMADSASKQIRATESLSGNRFA